MVTDLQVRVARRLANAKNVVVLELAHAGQGELPAFTAGAHIDVKTPCGAVRQYSLCGPPGRAAAYQIAVLREELGRGGSASLHDRLSEGDTLQVSAPRNHFPLREGTGPSVLFAAGIGITPIIAMAEELHDSGRDFVLHYCARSASHAAFVARLRSCAFAEQVRWHFSCGEAPSRLDIDAALAEADPASDIYVCGPSRFLSDIGASAKRAGWPQERIHVEHFAGLGVEISSGQGFDVVLARSGRRFTIPAERSIAQVLMEAGVAIETSCEQGVCGACLTAVTEGDVEHRDLYLTPAEQAENRQMLVCCSRARSARLVLDL